MKRETERRLIAWVPAAAYILLIFGVSSIPQLRPVIGRFVLSDKVSHLAEYSGLGVLLYWAFAGTFRERRLWLALVCTVLMGGAVGILDELYQTTVPGRLFEGLDWVADVSGTLIGSLAASFVYRRVQRRKNAPRRPRTNRRRKKKVVKNRTGDWT